MGPRYAYGPEPSTWRPKTVRGPQAATVFFSDVLQAKTEDWARCGSLGNEDIYTIITTIHGRYSSGHQALGDGGFFLGHICLLRALVRLDKTGCRDANG